MGAVIRMIDTGGRKKPNTITISSITASSSHFDRCRPTTQLAADWLMCR